MNKMINSYKCDLWLGNPCLYKDIEYEANKTYHFITKVIVVALKINGGKLCRLSLQRQLAHP